MKYVHGGSFTTEEFSIEETISEVRDVVGIAMVILKDNKFDSQVNIKQSLNLLSEVNEYLEYINKKVAKALKYVPVDVQEKEHL